MGQVTCYKGGGAEEGIFRTEKILKRISNQKKTTTGEKIRKEEGGCIMIWRERVI